MSKNGKLRALSGALISGLILALSLSVACGPSPTAISPPVATTTPEPAATATPVPAATATPAPVVTATIAPAALQPTATPPSAQPVQGGTLRVAGIQTGFA